MFISAWIPLLPVLAEPAWAATQRIEVRVTHDVTPGFYWCQHYDGNWSTYSSFLDQWYYAPDAGGQPAETRVSTQAEIAPPENDWAVSGDQSGKTYQLTDLIEPPVPIEVNAHITMDPNLHANPYIQNNMVIIEGTTGPAVKSGTPNSNICGHMPGYIYPFPVTVTWKGYIEITIPDEQYAGLEIVPTSSTLYVGETQQFVVYENWIRNGVAERNQVPNNKLTWSSNQASRASVSASGLVTGLQMTTTPATITATHRERNDSVSATVTVLERPTYIITGDFDILPSSTINYRDSFSLKPKNVVIPNGCTYQYHEYRIQKDGSPWTSPRVNGQTTQTSYTYSSYPPVLGVGDNYIQIKITANCGTAGTIDSGWTAGKTLTVLAPPNNEPPRFTAGFFKEFNRHGFVPDTEVVVGTPVNLRIIHDPSRNPPWPYDPDGDPITYTWLFSASDSAWIRSLPQEYGLWEHDEAHYNLVATQEGFHSVTVIGRDPFGAERRETVRLNVVPPNPVPVIDGPAEAKENRPLPMPFDGSRSYSPAGRKIVEYEWENKKEVYPKPGTETVKLHVVDEAGLRSLSPAVHLLTVQPDLPPVARLESPAYGFRKTDIVMENKSFSPDGDQIVSNVVTYRHDSDNDGSAAGETIHVISNADKRFTFRPPNIGDYHFTVEVEEDYGKTATATHVLKVINEAPTGTFSMHSMAPVPTLPEYTAIPASAFLADPWTTTTFDGHWGRKEWFVAGDSLSTNNYRGEHFFYNGNARYKNDLPVYNAITTDNVAIRPFLEDDVARHVLRDEYAVTKNITGGNEFESLNFRKFDGTTTIVTLPQLRRGYNGYSFYGPYLYARYYQYNHGCGSGGTWWHVYDVRELLSGNPGYVGDTACSSYDTGIITGVTDPPESPVDVHYAVAGYSVRRIASVADVTESPMVLWTYRLPSDVHDRYLDTSTRFVTNEDETRVAFTHSENGYTHMTVLDASTGQFVARVQLGPSQNRGNSTSFTPTATVRAAHGDRILVERWDGAGGLEGYDFSGERHPLDGSLTRYHLPGSHLKDIMIKTKDGYLLTLTVHNAGSLMYSSYSYGSKDVFVNIIDMEEGFKLVGRILVDQRSVYHAEPFIIQLLDDHKLYVKYRYRASEGDSRQQYAGFVITSSPSSRKTVEQGPSLGQFVNPDLSIKDGEFIYDLRFVEAAFDLNAYDKKRNAGFSFRMQDHNNMYRVTTDNYFVRLVKIVHGVETELAGARFDQAAGDNVTFKITAYGDRLRVFRNGQLIINVTDSTFQEAGGFGPYSKMHFVQFSNVGYSDANDEDAANRINNVALAGAEIRYETFYSDAENDPRIPALDEWTYIHEDPDKFLDSGDGRSGTSAWHNKTVSSPVQVLDKVGRYRVEYRVTDDPHPEFRHPSPVFGEYRERSAPYRQTLIVHRAPVAQFRLSVNPSNHHVNWQDASYDPDRWLSATNYSTEQTGIDYRATRGILERKYYYITPSGQMVQQQLITPTETGVYTVGLAVKDEYGAWSDWAVQTIDITETAAPNEPPKAGFTVTPATGYRGTTFTITSTATDKEDGPAANLQHAYYIRNVTEGGPETLQSASRGTWTKQFSSLGVMEIRQVVTDSQGATGQSVRTVTVENRGPAAQFDWSPNPAWEGDLVTFHNKSADPDGDPLSHAWHIREESGILVHATEVVHPVFRFPAPGLYTVTLTVTDGMVERRTARVVQVLPLTLEADVAHTPEWLAFHQERGHRTEEPPKQFYSGELLMLYARHAEAPVDWVMARLETTGEDGRPLTAETVLAPTEVPGLVSGELHDERFSSPEQGLPRGLHHIAFRIRYANGVEKTAVVPFEIIGHALGTVQVHRVR